MTALWLLRWPCQKWTSLSATGHQAVVVEDLASQHQCAYLEVNSMCSSVFLSSEMAFCRSLWRHPWCSFLCRYPVKLKGPILTDVWFFFVWPSKTLTGWALPFSTCRHLWMLWVRIITGTVCANLSSLAELFKNYFPVLRMTCKMHLSEWRCWSCANGVFVCLLVLISYVY